MQAIVRLYSVTPNEIRKFLNHFFGEEVATLSEENNAVKQWWQKDYPNPIEIVDIIGAYIENIEDYNLIMWISIDSGVFIKVTKENADELIRYLYERFPY